MDSRTVGHWVRFLTKEKGDTNNTLLLIVSIAITILIYVGSLLISSNIEITDAFFISLVVVLWVIVLWIRTNTSIKHIKKVLNKIIHNAYPDESAIIRDWLRE
jgi:surface polysaccharide O-acyltransferase-like enzyme